MTAPSSAAPPDLRAEASACRVRKRPIPVAVVFAAADGVIETLEGAVQHVAGDAILTGIQGEKWPVRRNLLLASYDPVPPAQPGQDGAYVKRPADALALKLQSTLTILVGQYGDPLRGHAGDWLLQYDDGSYGIVCDEVFRITYTGV